MAEEADADASAGTAADGPAHPVVAFDAFAFDFGSEELLRDGRPVTVRPQVARLLGFLLRAPGRLVTRQEIRDFLWPGIAVEHEQGINACMRQLREALGDDADAPRFVETVPRRGYRFVAEVRAATRAAGVVAAGAEAAPMRSTPPTSTGRDRRRWIVAVAAVVLLAVLGALAGSPRVRAMLGGAREPLGTIVIAPPITSGAPWVAEVGTRLEQSLLDVIDDGQLRAVRGRREPGTMYLESNVTGTADGFRVSFHLFDSRSGRLLWSQETVHAAADSATAPEARSRGVRSAIRVLLLE